MALSRAKKRAGAFDGGALPSAEELAAIPDPYAHLRGDEDEESEELSDSADAASDEDDEDDEEEEEEEDEAEEEEEMEEMEEIAEEPAKKTKEKKVKEHAVWFASLKLSKAQALLVEKADTLSFKDRQQLRDALGTKL